MPSSNPGDLSVIPWSSGEGGWGNQLLSTLLLSFTHVQCHVCAHCLTHHANIPNKEDRRKESACVLIRQCPMSNNAGESKSGRETRLQWDVYDQLEKERGLPVYKQ